MYLELPLLLQYIATQLQHVLAWVSGEKPHLGATFHSRLVAHSRKPIKCMLNTLFRECKQCQIVRKMQIVVPAAPISDTLIESAVAVYLIHICQWCAVQPCNTAGPNSHKQNVPRATAACVKLCGVDNALATRGRLAMPFQNVNLHAGRKTSAPGPRVAHP